MGGGSGLDLLAVGDGLLRLALGLVAGGLRLRAHAGEIGLGRLVAGNRLALVVDGRADIGAAAVRSVEAVFEELAQQDGAALVDVRLDGDPLELAPGSRRSGLGRLQLRLERRHLTGRLDGSLPGGRDPAAQLADPRAEAFELGLDLLRLGVLVSGGVRVHGRERSQWQGA